jgi:hypothetical protein
VKLTLEINLTREKEMYKTGRIISRRLYISGSVILQN